MMMELPIEPLEMQAIENFKIQKRLELIPKIKKMSKKEAEARWQENYTEAMAGIDERFNLTKEIKKIESQTINLNSKKTREELYKARREVDMKGLALDIESNLLDMWIYCKKEFRQLETELKETVNQAATALE